MVVVRVVVVITHSSNCKVKYMYVYNIICEFVDNRCDSNNMECNKYVFWIRHCSSYL